MYQDLNDHCFVSCVDDFTSKSLSGRESGCVTRCVQKFMAQSQRLSERFAELHTAQMQQQQQQFSR
jgi:mitochondrial import inner membrane translocase subunit TIM9